MPGEHVFAFVSGGHAAAGRKAKEFDSVARLIARRLRCALCGASILAAQPARHWSRIYRGLPGRAAWTRNRCIRRSTGLR